MSESMSEKIRILIVEDEFITLDNLKETVEDLGYEVSGVAMKADKAIDILEKKDSDLVLLDIRLKGEKTGLWVAEQIKNKYKIPFIFLTAFSDKRTIQSAVETRPSSYLLKPFTETAIYSAIEVALKNHTDQYLLTKDKENELIIQNTIFIKEGQRYKKARLSEIQYIKAFKNYLEITLNSGRLVIRSTLKNFYTKLPDTHFLYVHRSFIVNKNYVEEVSKNWVIVSGKKIPVTKCFREELLGRLEL